MADAALTAPPRLHLPGSPRARIAVAAVVVAAFAVGILQDHSTGSPHPSSAATVAVAPQKAAADLPAVGATTDTGAIAAPAPAEAQAASGSSTSTGSTTGAAAVDLGPSIVKTGTVALSVPAKKVSSALVAVTLVATQQGGQVSDSKTDESGDYPTGTITLRVPTAHTDDTVAALRKLGHVEGVTTASEDVTGQVVDTGARLKALEASRDRYLTLEGQAGTIAETLQVQQRIDDVQVQIEQLQGQQKSLADRTSLSTIAVTVSSSSAPTPVTTVHRRSGIAKAWADAKGSFADGIESVISASGTAAFLLLCALALGLLLLAARRVVGRRAAH